MLILHVRILSEPPTAVTMPGCTSHCYNVCRQTECTRTSHPRGYCVRHCPNCKGMKKKKQSSAAAAASSPAEDSEGDQKPAAVEPRPPKETEHRPKKKAKKAAATAAAAEAAPDEAESRPPVPGPMLSGGTIDLPLGPVSARLSCALCHGYFREPFTIAECLHTFCKRCLFLSFARGGKECPTCHVNLAPDPYRECLADRTMESIVDKLFPELRGADDEAEREFYAERGIKLKRQFREVASSDDGVDDGGKEHASKRQRKEEAERSAPTQPQHAEMDFRLLPDDTVDAAHSLPRLDRSSIRASDHLKVSQIKKYLMMRLHLADRRGLPASAIEICCAGGTVGDELSLTFIERTRWMQAGKEMVLSYRKRQEGMFG